MDHLESLKQVLRTDFAGVDFAKNCRFLLKRSSVLNDSDSSGR